jgi:outer membrane protein assembly factor BamB
VPDDRRRRLTLLCLALVSVLALAISVTVDRRSDHDGADHDKSAATATTLKLPKGQYFRTTAKVLADPAGFGKPYPNAKVEGLLTFRGNPSRSYYGVGPVPATPKVLHRFPDTPMCKSSENLGTTTVWCGMGWTGQPDIVERDGRTWAIFGGYDGHIHFMDAITGQRILPDIVTGDIIKGTPTIDPDGMPLVYSGSRDNLLRVIATDRPGQAEVLWTLDSESVKPTLWNDDWDSSPIILGDYMVEGSESSRFWVIKLNRKIDAAGLVQVDPKVVFTTEAWDAEAIAAIGDEDASVESSVAVYKDTVYFATSAGLVLGYDLSAVPSGGKAVKVFRWFSGNDADASVVVDDKGFLYTASEYDRPLARSREAGQLTKLDPRNKTNPIVWKLDESTHLKGGIYGTPGISGNMVYVATDSGRLIGLDRTTGAIRWERRLPNPTWGSPVIVDHTLLIGDCKGFFHAFDVTDPLHAPPEKWSLELGGCIEATPAVWKGRIYIGTRAGHLFVIGDGAEEATDPAAPTDAPKAKPGVTTTTPATAATATTAKAAAGY